MENKITGIDYNHFRFSYFILLLDKSANDPRKRIIWKNLWYHDLISWRSRQKVDDPAGWKILILKMIKPERSVSLKIFNEKLIRSFFDRFWSTFNFYVWFNYFNFINFCIIIVRIITQCKIFCFIDWSQRWFQLDIVTFA